MTTPNGVLRDMTDLEKGWIAGIIDGEGCISISCEKCKTTNNRRSPAYDLHIDVLMTDLPTIEKIKEITGVGQFKSRVAPEYEHYNQIHQWRVACSQAANLLRTIRPILVTKAKEADIAIAFDNLPKTKSCRLGVPAELTIQRESFKIALQEAKPRSISVKRGREDRLKQTGTAAKPR